MKITTDTIFHYQIVTLESGDRFATVLGNKKGGFPLLLILKCYLKYFIKYFINKDKSSLPLNLLTSLSLNLYLYLYLI